ncbi:hypothetical protein QR680_017750 [Steinernema hermaphroditum]|uniref:Uncharacterized protein n=1 Tax=Steinernema hermaphroditum TaxID=289476 RepID=A0AA39HI25_9BILA|nr:hypothetical protein QR680_017750 [Steinernema hermaphroditum]
MTLRCWGTLAFVRGLCGLLVIASIIGSVSSVGQSSSNEPLLMIKLLNGYDTRTWSAVNASWSDATHFTSTEFARILSLCDDEESIDYRCYIHTNGIRDRGIDDPDTVMMSNLFFVMHEESEDGEDSYFCATTWSGFDHKCMEHGLEKCIQSLPKNTIEAFLCKKMSREEVASMWEVFAMNVLGYTMGPMRNNLYGGGVFDVDEHTEGFWNRTGLKVLFQRPLRGTRNEHEERFLEDIYHNFAALADSDMIVHSCTPKNVAEITSFHGLGDPLVFSVARSYHPLLPKKFRGSACADSSKLAFSIPKDKERDHYYVCFGELPRDTNGISLGGGLFCWEDKQLNRDLRCRSVVGDVAHSSYPYTRWIFEEDEYSQWYSDCPEDLKEAVFEELETIYDGHKRKNTEKARQMSARVRKHTEEEIAEDGLDPYERFASLEGVRLMVWTVPHPALDNRYRYLFYEDERAVVLNVDRLIDEELATEKGSKAYSIPYDMEEGPFWFCEGGPPRTENLKNLTAELNCREDEKMNRRYRCASVPTMPFDAHEKPFEISEHVYTQWYSDCPEEIKDTIIGETRRILENRNIQVVDINVLKDILGEEGIRELVKKFAP